MFTRRDPNDTSPQAQPAAGARPEQAAPVRATTPVAPAAQQGTDSQGESLIAQEDTFEGTIRTTTGVRVLGTVRGTIESQRSVRIESGAQVEADITAEEVVIAGTYTGALTCRNRIEITSSARVSGKLDTVKLHLHEGGFFDGELHMQRPDDLPAQPAEASDEPRPRRSRYVDINAESTRAVGSDSPDLEKTGDPAS